MKVYIINNAIKYINNKLLYVFNVCKENADTFILTIRDICTLSKFGNKRIRFTFNMTINHKNNSKFNELSVMEFSKHKLSFMKEVQKYRIKLKLPKSNSTPCKFTVCKALCLGLNLNQMFCSSSPNKSIIKISLDNFMRNTYIKFDVLQICKECNVLPICLRFCRLLNPHKNGCIPEKYILQDILKLYLDSPEKWN